MRTMNNIVLFPVKCNDTRGFPVSIGALFMVVSTKPEENFLSEIRYYDLHRPWLILLDDRVGLIDILNISFTDVTPFVKPNGDSWFYDYFLEI